MSNVHISIPNDNVKKINIPEIQEKPRWNVKYNINNDSWVLSNSMAKALFGSNLYELIDEDKKSLWHSMQDGFAAKGLSISLENIANSNVWYIEYGKNIVLSLSISIPNILSVIKHAQVKAVWAMGHTRYFQVADNSNGEKVVFGSTHHKVTFYDKTKEMLQRGTQEEKELARTLLREGKQILRMEVKYGTASTIKRMLAKYLPQDTAYTLDNLYNTQLCQRILIDHWNTILAGISADVDYSADILKQQLAVALQSGLSLNMALEMIMWKILHECIPHNEIRRVIVDKTLNEVEYKRRLNMWYGMLTKAKKNRLSPVCIQQDWERFSPMMEQQLVDFKPIRPNGMPGVAI